MSKKKSFLSKIINFLFVLAIVIGAYFGYMYLNDNYLNNEESVQTNVETEDNIESENTEKKDKTKHTQTDTEDEDDSFNVSVIKITKDPLKRINFQKVGTVAPYKKVTVTSESSGTVKNLKVSEGDTVKKNFKIAEISDSVATEIAKINYDSSKDSLDFAEESLDGTEESVGMDIQAASIAVDTAQNNYNNALASYNNLEQSLKEQIKASKLSVQSAQTGLLAAQEGYYNTQATSTTNYKNSLRQFYNGISSSLSVTDGAFDIAETVYRGEISSYADKSETEDLKDSIEDGRDEYYDILDDYEDNRNNEDTAVLKSILNDTIDLLNDAEDILYETKDIIEDIPDEDGEDISAILPTLKNTETTINTILPTIDQSKGSLMMNIQSLDSLKANSQITPENAFTQMEMAEQQLASARQALEIAEKNKKSQLDSAQNAIENAKNQLKSARTQLDNIKAKGNLQVIGAKKQVLMMESQVNTSKVNLDASEIHSPIEGTILTLYVEEGNYINPQQRILEIADIEKVKITVSLTTEELSFVKLGQKVKIKAAGGIEEEGMITKILPALDPVSKKIIVEIVLPNQEGTFKAGMFTDVFFKDAQNLSPSIYVPYKSIVFVRGETYVYIVENNKAIKRKVSLGGMSGNKVEITDGLQMNERVITDGAKLVEDGVSVSVN